MYLLNYRIFTIMKIFAEKRVRYAGQAIGLLLARDKYTAFGARSKVHITYENVKQPVLDIRDVVPRKLTDSTPKSGVDLANLALPCRGINAQTARQMAMNGMNNRVDVDAVVEVEGEVSRNIHEVKGEFQTHAQFHFSLENQICLCVPNEDGMDVYSATQHMDSVQVAVAGNFRLVNLILLNQA